MTALLGRVARTAERRTGNRLESVAIEDIKPGDVLLIRAGEAVPVDGLITGTAVALLDESALTGEAIPVRHNPGSLVASGVTNAGAPFELEAAKTAAQSTYSGVLRLSNRLAHRKPRCRGWRTSTRWVFCSRRFCLLEERGYLRMIGGALWRSWSWRRLAL
jgi:cation transport ATPase